MTENCGYGARLEYARIGIERVEIVGIVSLRVKPWVGRCLVLGGAGRFLGLHYIFYFNSTNKYYYCYAFLWL